jgi:hypothetical protein
MAESLSLVAIAVLLLVTWLCALWLVWYGVRYRDYRPVAWGLGLALLGALISVILGVL